MTDSVPFTINSVQCHVLLDLSTSNPRAYDKHSQGDIGGNTDLPIKLVSGVSLSCILLSPMDGVMVMVIIHPKSNFCTSTSRQASIHACYRTRLLEVFYLPECSSQAGSDKLNKVICNRNVTEIMTVSLALS